MANEDKKDFNAMLHDNKDMPKFQIITDQKSIEKYGGSKMYFAPPIDYDRVMKKIPYGKVITVGTGTEAGGEYSGQGPVLGSCVCKPDIIAPATNILSCDNHGKSYKKRSGTSMATPIVSGTIALLLSNEPWLSNRDVKIRLMQNAVDCGMAKSRQGWGLLNPEGMLRIK